MGRYDLDVPETVAGRAGLTAKDGPFNATKGYPGEGPVPLREDPPSPSSSENLVSENSFQSYRSTECTTCDSIDRFS